MKFNLYISSDHEKKTWERFAKKEHRSLSQFIRIAVHEKIQRMKQEDEIQKEITG